MTDAKAALVEARRALEQAAALRTISGQDSDLVAAFVDAWTGDAHFSSNRASTQARYLDHVRHFVLPFFGARAVGSLTKADLAKWLAWAPKQTSKRGQLHAPATLLGAWRSMSVFFKFIAREANLPNLFDGTVRFKVDKRHLPALKARPTYAPEEVWKLLEELERVRLRRHPNERERRKVLLILRVAAMTGARIGEVTALHREDVDVDSDVVTFRRSNNKGILNDATKTGTVRSVPLDPTTRDLLAEYLGGWSPSDKHGGLLFLSQRGTLLRSKRFQTFLDRATERAGLPRITPHAFRRTVTNNVRRTSSDKVVTMSIVGHESEEMHRHYSNAGIDEKRAALQRAIWPSRVLEEVLGASAAPNGASALGTKKPPISGACGAGGGT